MTLLSSDPSASHDAPYTPGPWSIESDRWKDLAIRSTTSPRLCVALITGGLDEGCHTGPTSRANAQLIAAAPTMYEALKAVIGSAFPHPVEHPAMHKAWQIAEAAIAKAEGR